MQPVTLVAVIFSPSYFVGVLLQILSVDPVMLPVFGAAKPTVIAFAPVYGFSILAGPTR